MSINDLKNKSKNLAIGIVRFSDRLPRTRSTDIIARQIIRCSTSVGANYRAACIAKSKSDFISKMKIVEEESDETLYWLELIEDLYGIRSPDFQEIRAKVREFLAITVSSIKTARNNN